MNINNFETYTADDVYSLVNCTVGSGTITVASNSDGSIAKIYSDFDITSLVDTGTVVVTIQSSLRPTSNFTIRPAGIVVRRGVTAQYVDKTYLKLYTDGRIEIYIRVASTEGYYNVLLFPCVYLIKDFGDLDA